jgi:hypothetical protein
MMYHDCSGSATFVIHRASLRCVVGPGRTQAPHSSSQLANASTLFAEPIIPSRACFNPMFEIVVINSAGKALECNL